MSFPARRHDIVAPQFERALALHRDGRFDKAARGDAVVLRTVPDHIPALCCLSLCQGARGMAGQALRVGVRVAALAPDCAEA